MPNRLARLRSVTSAVAVMSVAASSPLAAQYPETNLTPRGVLRLSFEPWYINYKRIFDSVGTDIPLGTPLTKDSARPNFQPSLIPPQSAIRSMIDDST